MNTDKKTSDSSEILTTRPVSVSIICITGIILSISLLLFAILNATFSSNLSLTNVSCFILGTGFLTSYILMLHPTCKPTRDSGRFIMLLLLFFTPILVIPLLVILVLTHTYPSNYDAGPAGHLLSTAIATAIAVVITIAINICLFRKSIRSYWR